MCAGQAHWQNGIVERHIGTFREMFKKLSLDDRLECEDDHSVTDRVCWSKNHNGRYGGYSPAQWFLGSSHPLIDSEHVGPNITRNSPFEENLQRKVATPQAFHEAEAKTILRIAATPRSRTLRNPEAGQLVFLLSSR